MAWHGLGPGQFENWPLLHLPHERQHPLIYLQSFQSETPNLANEVPVRSPGSPCPPCVPGCRGSLSNYFRGTTSALKVNTSCNESFRNSAATLTHRQFRGERGTFGDTSFGGQFSQFAGAGSPNTEAPNTI